MEEKELKCTSTCVEDAERLGISVDHYPWCALYEPMKGHCVCKHCNGTGYVEKE